jgi:hypothetical protein
MLRTRINVTVFVKTAAKLIAYRAPEFPGHILAEKGSFAGTRSTRQPGRITLAFRSRYAILSYHVDEWKIHSIRNIRNSFGHLPAALIFQ